MNKHILVISQYFYPEQFRINDICAEWDKRGYQVTVVTGIPNYPEGKYYRGYGLFQRRRETYGGIQIVRLPLFPRGNNSLTLGLNYLSFVLSGLVWKTFTRLKADFVFIFEVSPMTQALPGVWYAKRLGIPCILYVQDLWPENVTALSGITSRRFISSIGVMVDYIYARCDLILCPSRGFVAAVSGRGVPKEKIEYWPQYAEEITASMARIGVPEIPKDNSFNVVFAGNIGFAQGLDILPKAAEIIISKTAKRFRFNIVGDGRFKEELKSLVNAKRLDGYFNFIPKQPATRMPEFMKANDIAFLGLAENSVFSMTIPAKLQTYMACGIPCVAAAAGETARIIDEANAGLCGPPGDAAQLAENIMKLMDISSDSLKQLGENARKYCDIHFNKELLLNIMDEYFGDKISASGGTTCSNNASS